MLDFPATPSTSERCTNEIGIAEKFCVHSKAIQNASHPVATYETQKSSDDTQKET